MYAVQEKVQKDKNQPLVPEKTLIIIAMYTEYINPSHLREIIYPTTQLYINQKLKSYNRLPSFPVEIILCAPQKKMQQFLGLKCQSLHITSCQQKMLFKNMEELKLLKVCFSAQSLLIYRYLVQEEVIFRYKRITVHAHVCECMHIHKHIAFMEFALKVDKLFSGTIFVICAQGFVFKPEQHN